MIPVVVAVAVATSMLLLHPLPWPDGQHWPAWSSMSPMPLPMQWMLLTNLFGNGRKKCNRNNRSLINQSRGRENILAKREQANERAARGTSQPEPFLFFHGHQMVTFKSNTLRPLIKSKSAASAAFYQANLSTLNGRASCSPTAAAAAF